MRLSIHWLVGLLAVQVVEISAQWPCVTAPAHPQVTGAVMYKEALSTITCAMFREEKKSLTLAWPTPRDLLAGKKGADRLLLQSH